MNEKIIEIGGKSVKMLYCAATENGYEDITGKSINVFVPEFGQDENGNDIITKPADAKIGDYISLAIAGIVSAYTRDNEELPISDTYILYNATPEERNMLITAIVELRNAWYHLPVVVADKRKSRERKPTTGKNA